MHVKQLNVELMLNALLQDIWGNANVRMDMLEMLLVIKVVDFVKYHARRELIAVKISTAIRGSAKVRNDRSSIKYFL